MSGEWEKEERTEQERIGSKFLSQILLTVDRIRAPTVVIEGRCGGEP
jgi:hypothetical protein